MVDQQKIRRESMRWQILLTLNLGRPHAMHEDFIVSVMRDIWPDTVATEVRRELDYLSDRGLLDLDKRPSGAWLADLTRYGIDIVEYTIDVEPGIARPVKYWES